MMLFRCEACNRHVRAEESECPFCNAALGGAPPEETSSTTSNAGLSRREMFALAATAVAASACRKKPPAMPYGCVWSDGDELLDV